MIDHDILRVPDLNVACKDRCEIISIECILACDNDTLCMSQCSRDNTECLNGKIHRPFMLYTLKKSFQIVRAKPIAWMVVTTATILFVIAR